VHKERKEEGIGRALILGDGKARAASVGMKRQEMPTLGNDAYIELPRTKKLWLIEKIADFALDSGKLSKEKKVKFAKLIYNGLDYLREMHKDKLVYSPEAVIWLSAISGDLAPRPLVKAGQKKLLCIEPMFTLVCGRVDPVSSEVIFSYRKGAREFLRFLSKAYTIVFYSSRHTLHSPVHCGKGTATGLKDPIHHLLSGLQELHADYKWPTGKRPASHQGVLAT